MSVTYNVLMTGAGAPGAPGIIKCLLQEPAIKLTVADADENAVGKYLHPDFVGVPKGDDERFIPSILDVCREKNIKVLLPLVTKELLPLAKNKHLFETIGTKVLVSSSNSIAIANNKSACYRFLQAKGIQVPQFMVATTADEFKKAADVLGYPQKTFCFKPSQSNGSRGFRVVSDTINEADLLFNYKPNNTYIAYDQAVKILSSQPFPELLVAEYLPGSEYSIDCLTVNGKAVLVVPRERQKMINGISVQGVFLNNSALIDYATHIIEALALEGNIGIQIKLSGEEKPLLLEINPRVQGTIVSALGAGVNLPLLAIKTALGVTIKPAELNVAWGTCFSRYWTEVFY